MVILIQINDMHEKLGISSAVTIRLSRSMSIREYVASIKVSLRLFYPPFDCFAAKMFIASHEAYPRCPQIPGASKWANMEAGERENDIESLQGCVPSRTAADVAGGKRVGENPIRGRAWFSSRPRAASSSFNWHS